MSDAPFLPNPYPVPRPQTEIAFPRDPRAAVWYEGFDAGLAAALEALTGDAAIAAACEEFSTLEGRRVAMTAALQAAAEAVKEVWESA